MKADPAAVVGMCTSMHAEFKKATLYNEELRSLPEFMKSMKSQYLTSMEVGKLAKIKKKGNKLACKKLANKNFWQNRKKKKHKNWLAKI